MLATLNYLLGGKRMSPEIIKWLADMPKGYQLSGSKEAYYNGQKQLKLFLSKKN